LAPDAHRVGQLVERLRIALRVDPMPIALARSQQFGSKTKSSRSRSMSTSSTSRSKQLVVLLSSAVLDR